MVDVSINGNFNVGETARNYESDPIHACSVRVAVSPELGGGCMVAHTLTDEEQPLEQLVAGLHTAVD